MPHLYDSKYYDNVRIFAWTLMTKILTLIFLSLWFITCKHWWRLVILVPIIIESYKIADILNDDLRYIDDDELRH